MVGPYWIYGTAVVIKEAPTLLVLPDTIAVAKRIEKLLDDVVEGNPGEVSYTRNFRLLNVYSARLTRTASTTALALKTNSVVKKI